MVVAPGTYSTFKVTYTLYDSVTGTESTISYTYRNIKCNAGKNQKISTDLGMATYTSCKSNYYMWDAKNNYWDGYVSSQPLLNNARKCKLCKIISGLKMVQYCIHERCPDKGYKLMQG